MPPRRRGRLSRAAPIVGLTGRTAGGAVVVALRRRIGSADAAEFHARTSERYAAMLGNSKGVLMKAGQVLSFVTLGSLIPPEQQHVYRAALERLQADAPPMEPALAESVVEAELGMPLERAFAEFDPNAFAAASIGQVHAARLPDGRRVAVKVQYPGVDEAIQADLDNTELLATFLRIAQKTVPGLSRIDMRTVADEVSNRIGDEIDYRREAANQAEFAQVYRGHPFIRVPEIVPELSTARVLTMDLVEGRRWADALTAEQALRDRWGEVVFRFGVGSLRRLGAFHADPHPGNYLFHDDGTVTFLDFGCVKRFSPDQVHLLVQLVGAGMADEPESVWDLLVTLGVLDAQDAPTPAEFRAWFREQMRPLLAPQPFTFTREYAAAQVTQEFSPIGPAASITRRLGLPRDFVFLARIDLGLTAVLGELNATGPWGAIRNEWDEAAPPATELGELDAAHWRQVGGPEESDEGNER